MSRFIRGSFRYFSLFVFISAGFTVYAQYPGPAEKGVAAFGAPDSVPNMDDSESANALYGAQNQQGSLLPPNDDPLFPPTEASEGKGTVSVAELQHPLSRKARSLIFKAQTALHQGNMTECFQDLDKAMKERSAEPYVHGVRGAALLMTGHVADAIPELEQAVQILPLPANYSNLGYAYILNGQAEKGEDLVRRAASSPDSPMQSHYLMGLLQLDSKAHAGDACVDLERAQNLMPAAHMALAVCYAKDGQGNASEGQIRKVLGPQNESWFDFWKKWVTAVAAEPAPAQAFGLHLKPAPGTKF